MAVSVARMAIYWPTQSYKGRTFKLCVLTRWDFNFCIRSSPLRAGGGEGGEDKADRGRGGNTRSGNGQAWSSPSPRGQWRTGKNGENCCKIICGAPTTRAVKGLIIMMMMSVPWEILLSFQRKASRHREAYRFNLNELLNFVRCSSGWSLLLSFRFECVQYPSTQEFLFSFQPKDQTLNPPPWGLVLGGGNARGEVDVVTLTRIPICESRF